MLPVEPLQHGIKGHWRKSLDFSLKFLGLKKFNRARFDDVRRQIQQMVPGKSRPLILDVPHFLNFHDLYLWDYFLRLGLLLDGKLLSLGQRERL